MKGDFAADYYRSWCFLRQQQPQLNFFQQLGCLNIAPGKLLASALGKECFLIADWQQTLPAVSSLERVIACTPNACTIAAAAGKYHKLSLALKAQTGMVLSAAIDLRFTLKHWTYALAQQDKFSHQISLNFLDNYANLLHRIVLLDTTDLVAWLEENLLLVTSKEQQAINFLPPPTAEIVANEAVDAVELRRAWAALHDTHHFYRLLAQFKVSRLQALQLAGNQWACPVAKKNLITLLTAASQEKIKLMLFTVNGGCMQIASGFIYQVSEQQSTISLASEHFNWQINTAAVASVWLVRKPTKVGRVTCWEIYDCSGDLAAQIYGWRATNNAENPSWRRLAESFA